MKAKQSKHWTHSFLRLGRPCSGRVGPWLGRGLTGQQAARRARGRLPVPVRAAGAAPAAPAAPAGTHAARGAAAV